MSSVSAAKPRKTNALVYTIATLLLAACAQAQSSALTARLRQLAFAGAAIEARDLAESYRGRFHPEDPALLEALSWVGRAGVIAEDWELARHYGEQVYEAASKLAAAHGVDSSPQLATALGASIEVLGKAYDAAGDRPFALQFLHSEREKRRGSSIETRIQKNYLLISIEGKPMPPITADRFIGSPKPLDAKGKVALFYFWAHWCSDCKAQKPVLLELHKRYAERGLAVIAPTQLFGYAESGRPATPEQEIAYIEGPWRQASPMPDWMPMPVSQKSWADFGVSTTPTIVIVDRQGVVRLYYPGQMSLEELEKAITPLL